MKIFSLVFLFSSAFSAIFDKKSSLTRSEYTKVILTVNTPSLLSCAQKCKWRNSEVHFKDGVCKCYLRTSQRDEINDNGLNKEGMVYEMDIKKGSKGTIVNYCSLKVLHNVLYNRVGRYFLFRIGKMKKLIKDTTYRLDAMNSRTKKQGEIKIWVTERDSGYNGHGRFKDWRNDDWQAGDEVVFMDHSYCTKEIIYQS